MPELHKSSSKGVGRQDVAPFCKQFLCFDTTPGHLEAKYVDLWPIHRAKHIIRTVLIILYKPWWVLLPSFIGPRLNPDQIDDEVLKVFKYKYSMLNLLNIDKLLQSIQHR